MQRNRNGAFRLEPFFFVLEDVAARTRMWVSLGREYLRSKGRISF